MKFFFNRLWNWFRGWFRREPGPLRVERVEELPDQLAKNTLYIAGESGYLWFVAMLCPCSCGQTLYMNLQEKSRPRWTLIDHGNGLVSLSPSVWRQVGCKSHFYLRQGTVVWCDHRADYRS